MKAKRRLDLGKAGEEEAARFLSGLGYEVLERSWRSALGEVDLIVRDKETLVFVEVKTRSSPRFGSAEAVDARKQARLVKAALAYLQDKRIGDVPMRFDVVAIEAGRLSHIRDAFSAGGYTR